METASVIVKSDLNHILDVFEENAAHSDEVGETSPESLKALRDSGLLGSLVPLSYGGLGKSVIYATRLIERIGSVDPVWMIFG